MVQDVFSLHNIVGSDESHFPFSLKDYQRYVFGDDRLAHRLGTDLCRAFIPTISNPTDDFAVAVLSEKVPTATHRLRNHFVAYLNRHLIANNATPALKIDFHMAGVNAKTRDDPQCNRKSAYHIDAERLRDADALRPLAGALWAHDQQSGGGAVLSLSQGHRRSPS